jgi:gamma-glutamyltranspeptidase/glutathione hydrolase
MRTYRPQSRVLALYLLLVVATPCTGGEKSAGKTARGRHGMVATGSPYATAAGVSILESGGNAVDAAVAASFALMVADPPMTSLGGRAQILLLLKDGRLVGIDGATQAPAGVPPLSGEEDTRSGYQIVPLPGAPAALAEAVARYGRLPLSVVLQPAIKLAEEGFVVTSQVGESWKNVQDELAANPGASQNYLKPDGSPYRTGELFRHPRLARVLRQLAEAGPDVFYRGPVAEAIAWDVKSNGGFLEASDLENYQPQAAEVVRTTYRGFDIATLGGNAWGHTLAEMLNILGHFSLHAGDPTPEEIELLARVIAQALADRPQRLGSLEPKPDGYPLDLIASPAFARQRAEEIRQEMSHSAQAPGETPFQRRWQDHETTHLAVLDDEGNAVSLTMSIGPRFGSRVAAPELGFLYAHSYRMRSRPTPGERDATEMTPTIVLREGQPVLAVGAAGSARIPAAILQVISNVIDRGYSLEKAVAAPRVYAEGNQVRMHTEFPAAFAEAVRARGFEIEPISRRGPLHLGTVQAAGYYPESGEYVGAADPVYDGTAAGPAISLRKVEKDEKKNRQH